MIEPEHRWEPPDHPGFVITGPEAVFIGKVKASLPKSKRVGFKPPKPKQRKKKSHRK